MIEFHHRRQRALPEAGHDPQRRAAVGGGDGQLFLAVLQGLKAQAHHDLFVEVTRSPGVAGGTTAHRDDVATLRRQIEQRVKCNDTVDSGQRDFRLGGDVFDRFARQIFLRIVVLDLLQNGQQTARPADVPGEHLVDELTIEGGRPLHCHRLHSATPHLARVAGGRGTTWHPRVRASVLAGPDGAAVRRLSGELQRGVRASPGHDRTIGGMRRFLASRSASSRAHTVRRPSDITSQRGNTRGSDRVAG